jgi:tRNA dimethylallyltransferase
LRLAEKFSGQIVCCDSVQVYRGFDIGSAKPSAAERRKIPHHLFDIVDPVDEFSAGDYRERALGLIQDLNASGGLPIVVGGTGLYLRALLGSAWDAELPDNPRVRERLAGMTTERLRRLLHRLDPVRAAEIHPNDRYRLARALELRVLTRSTAAARKRSSAAADAVSALTIILDPPREELHRRIEQRTDSMLEFGLIDEVRALIAQGIPLDCKPMKSIGYRQVVEWLPAGGAQVDLRDRILAATRQYAKRQVTWFKKTPSDLRISQLDFPSAEQAISRFLTDQ